MKSFSTVFKGMFNIFKSGNPHRDKYFEALLKLFDVSLEEKLTWDFAQQVLTNHFEQKAFVIQEDINETSLDESYLEFSTTFVLGRLIENNWLKKRIDHKNHRVTLHFTDPGRKLTLVFKDLVLDKNHLAEHLIVKIYNGLKTVLDPKEENIIRFHSFETACEETKNLQIYLDQVLDLVSDNIESIFQMEIANDLIETQILEYFSQFIDKNYQRLKTSDNLYKFKLKTEMMINEVYINEKIRDILIEEFERKDGSRDAAINYVYGQLRMVQGIFAEMSDRIREIDSTHNRYLNTAYQRYKYLQTQDDNYIGNLTTLIQILSKRSDETIEMISRSIPFFECNVFQDESIYKPRRKRKFSSSVLEICETDSTDLSEEEII